MNSVADVSINPMPSKRLNVFERYLTLWVALCMIVGVAVGKWTLRRFHAA